MSSLVVFNAFSIPRLPVSKPVVIPSVPQHKPFASQRKLQSFALNPAIDSGPFSGTHRSPFVRPDVPPVVEDNLRQKQARDAETTAEASFKARPQFRSALEQVSFVTNNKLWATHEHHDEDRQQQRILGIFGL